MSEEMKKAMMEVTDEDRRALTNILCHGHDAKDKYRGNAEKLHDKILNALYPDDGEPAQSVEAVVIHYLGAMASKMRGDIPEEELKDTDLGWEIDMVDHTIGMVEKLKRKDDDE